MLGDPVLSWPEQNKVETYSCSYVIDPKPGMIFEDERLPYYNFSNTKSISISIESDSPEILFSIYELKNATYDINKVICKEIFKEKVTSPFTHELALKDKTDYLIISETSDKKEFRTYFTTFNETYF